MTDYRRERQSHARRCMIRRGRPTLRWEDYVQRDARKAGEEEDWKKKTRGWKILSDEAVKKLRTAPYPMQTKRKEKEREIDPKHDKPNHLLHCPLSCLNNTERKIVLTATKTSASAEARGNATMTVRSVRRPYTDTVRKIQSSHCYYSCVMLMK